ncbi:MAG TPA: glycan-binding surface protein [Xylanibacter oryzae]|nr:glycan-binding surface protein [Xylanibacter oryzae]
MKKLKYILISCIALTSTVLTSCSENDGDSYPGGNAAVVVNKIYLEDTESKVPDREVSFARLGQILRLSGSGFGGTKKILVNGYDTYFNTALATDNSMILQLLSKTPVSTAPDSVRNKIQFVKDNGTSTYNFVIRAASPQISSVSNTLPQAGETVVVNGVNLQETSKVTLPGGVEVTDITNPKGDDAGKWFSFVMPSSVTEGGSITTEGANGTAVSAEYFNNKNCIILDFDGSGTQGYWGWSHTGSMINKDSDLVADPLNSGRGIVCPMIPARMQADGVAAGKNRVSEVWTAGNGNDMDDWTRMYKYIPKTTPLTDVAFQFDIYVPESWSNTGYIQVNLANNSSFTGYGSNESKSLGVAYYIPWIKSDAVSAFKTTGWQTVTIPFSQFGKFAAEIADSKTPTFQELVEYRNSTDYKNCGLAFINGDFTYSGIEYKSSVCKQNIYIDNFRVVPCKSSVVSDFSETATIAK